MTVFGGLQYDSELPGSPFGEDVSIPMTVFGGLQSDDGFTIPLTTSFNTDDGIWRAAMRARTSNTTKSPRFNTDDGIWRAAIGLPGAQRPFHSWVSIPMTVFGGLQFVMKTSIVNEAVKGFNTDDGIWRAAMTFNSANINAVVSFQYR